MDIKEYLGSSKVITLFEEMSHLVLNFLKLKCYNKLFPYKVCSLGQTLTCDVGVEIIVRVWKPYEIFVCQLELEIKIFLIFNLFVDKGCKNFVSFGLFIFVS
jgi:hypothetical protein